MDPPGSPDEALEAWNGDMNPPDKADEFKAARRLVKRFPDQTIAHLAQNEASGLLRETCGIKGLEYFTVMGESSDVEDDDMKSLSSRRRTLSSSENPLSTAPTSISRSYVGADFGSTSRKAIWIAPESLVGSKPARVELGCLPASACLIQSDVVRGLAGFEPDDLGGQRFFSYDKRNLSSTQVISLKWARNKPDFTADKVQNSDFYLVDSLSDGQVALGPAEIDLSRWSVQPESAIQGSPPNRCLYGSKLTQPPFDQTETENSTTPTIRGFAPTDGASRMAANRARSNASSSFRTATSRRQDDGADSLSATPSSDKVAVQLHWEGSKRTWKLDLIWEGESFYNELEVAVRRIRRDKRHLNRETDYVDFSTSDVDTDRYCLQLDEDEVMDSWAGAIEQLETWRRTAAHAKIIACIRSSSDDLDD